ncbi:MAG: transposase [Rhodobacteraceae bacterium]|nr:transposase [Paracoccaceae bacterium]
MLWVVNSEKWQRLLPGKGCSKSAPPLGDACVTCLIIDECLNENLFSSLLDARGVLEIWQHDYNHQRPHSVLGNVMPMEFAEKNNGQTGSRAPSIYPQGRYIILEDT